MNHFRFTSLLALALAVTLVLPVSAQEPENWLVPKTREYTGQFTDVTGAWCEAAVKTVYEADLMVGKSADYFDPGGTLMPEQLVAICARLHSRLTGGSAAFPAPTAEESWYDPYYTYLADALDFPGGVNGLMFHVHATKYPVLRWMFAELLGWSLEAAGAALPEINDVDAIPDGTSSWYGKDYILPLYRAGVVTGKNEYGFLGGNDPMTRAQAAVILARAVDPALRQKRAVKPFDLCRDVLGTEPESTALTVGGRPVTMAQAARELCLSLQQEDCDAFGGDIPRDDLAQSLTTALTELRTDAAIDRLAAREGLSWTRTTLETDFGPLPPDGYMGVTEAGWLWEYSHSHLSQQLLALYTERYGTAVDPATGDTAAQVRFSRDLDAMADSLTVTLSPALENLDLSDAQARLMALFPCE